MCMTVFGGCREYAGGDEQLSVRRVPGLRGEVGIKSDEFILFQFLCYVCMVIQSGGNICMPQGILDHFYIYTSLTH